MARPSLAISRALGALLPILVLACSRGGAPDNAGLVDVRPVDDLAHIDLARPDLASAPDLSSCITSFTCDARTAEHECGVTTATGQRYPDRGLPYCTDKLSRENCSCDLVRCASPLPLCPGRYQAIFRQRLIAGCNGVAGQLDGTCESLWNVVATWPGGQKLVDKSQLNVYLSFAVADYTETFTLAAPTAVRLVVEQDCWFADVSGVGNAGRSEVERARVMPE